MMAALSRSRADQQRLVQDAGHELRTPMTSLRTNLYALRSFDGLTPESRARVLADIESETEELSRLIDEVVEVATDRRGDEPLTEVDLRSVADGVAAGAATRWEREVAVHHEGAVTVVGRSESLGRAVRNLVENACKFDRSGGPVQVRVEATPADGDRPAGVTLDVLDRGPGIPEEDLPHVFERFHRSVEARSRSGSGLGLAIVAEVVAAHGGVVRAVNRDGGGAAVGFWVPAGPPG
jgi:two-component system sensor histidine kinase MprB